MILPKWIEDFKKHISECEHDYCRAEDKPLRNTLEALTIAWAELEEACGLYPRKPCDCEYAEALRRIEELGK